MLNLIKEQDDDNLIDKIYLYAEDLNEPTYQFLIKKREDVGTKHLNDPKSIYSTCKYYEWYLHNNIDDYNPTRKTKILCLMKWLQILWLIKNFKP